MELSVTKNKVAITTMDQINSGEFKITTCNFTFSDTYDDLVKRAIFTHTKNGKSYEVLIENNSCDIPTDVIQEGVCEIGVYAYETNGNDLVLRYSPTPARFQIKRGSYKSAEEGSTYLPADEFVTIEDFNTSQGIQNTNISANTNAINGIKNGTTINSFLAVENALPTKVSDLNNDSGFITKSVDDLTNYYTKSEVNTKISAVYKFKGSVSTYVDLPSTDLTVGDVYNVEEDGSNYAWTGTTWDKLGGDVDLSDYYTKSQIDNMIGDINTALDQLNGEVV